jgi:site-specific recombinase XerD
MRRGDRMITFEQALAGWLQHLEIEHRCSPSTVSRYGRAVRAFYRHLLPDGDGQNRSHDHLPALQRKHGSVEHIADVTCEHLAAYVAHLRHDHDYAEATTRNYIRNLQALFSFLADTGTIPANPAAQLASLPVGDSQGDNQGMRRTLSDDEVALLFAEVGKTDSWLAVRDQAILHTLLSTGMRVSELVALDLSDLSSSGRLHIRGKRERSVSLSDAAHSAVAEWLGRREERETPRSQALFLSRRSRRRIPARTVERRVRQHAEAAGLKDVNAYTLRDTFVRQLLERGTTPSEVRRVIGVKHGFCRPTYGIPGETKPPNRCADCGVQIRRNSTRCRSCAMKARWADPEARARLSTPEARAARSEAAKRRWKDVDYRRRQFRARMRPPKLPRRRVVWTGDDGEQD